MARPKNTELAKRAMKLNNLQLELTIQRAYRSANLNSMFGDEEKAEEQQRLGDWLSELKKRREEDE